MEYQPYFFLSGLKLLSASSEHGTLSLSFDDGVLSVFNSITGSGFESSVKAAEAVQFLCGCTVLDAYSEQGRLNLDFGGIYLHISLKDEDCSGPEAACWHGKDGRIIVIN